MKRYQAYIWTAFTVLLVVFVAAFRGDMIEYISRSRSSNMTGSRQAAVAETISERYNYSRNGLDWSVTFLEFGSTGCSACRQMQQVMEKVRSRYPGKVNVVFIDVAEAGNMDIVDYYGIVTIPAQILLERDGEEFYRHNGYISAEDLSAQIDAGGR